MNTEIETAYEDTLNQIGHIAALVCELLKQLDEESATPSVAEDIKFQFLQHEELLIHHLHQAEAGVREVQILVDEWTALARARLQ